MVIDYDHNPNITDEQRVQSLKESVQMAFNENEDEHLNIRKAITDIKGAIPDLIVERASETTSVSVGAGTMDHKDIVITKDGYKPIGIVGFTGSGTGSLTWSDWYIKDDDTARLWYKNQTSAAITLTAVHVNILYMKIK